MTKSRITAAVRVSAAVGAAALVAAAAGDRLVQTSARATERNAALERLVPYGHALSLAVGRRTSVLLGIKAFVEVRWGEASFPGDFDAFAAAVGSATPGIRTLQYAIGGVIQRTYPASGNAVVGLDVKHHPDLDVRRDFRRAEESTQLIISGPLRLDQGGEGIVARIAARDRKGSLLCVVAAVLDLPSLLQEARLESSGLLVALVNEDQRVLAGPATVLEGDPVSVELPVADRRWRLAARPQSGWEAAIAGRLLVYRARVLLLCALLALIAYLLAARHFARARERESLARHLDDERFALLYRLVPDGVVLTRLRDRVVMEVNDAFLALTGYGREELVGRTAAEIGWWDDPEEAARLREALLKDGFLRSRAARLLRKDRTELEVDCSFRLFELQGERCILAIVRDVTESRQLQEKLQQAQKMEAVGTLAGGVAHDFNNIITVIQSYAELVAQELPLEAPAREDVQQITEATQRAAALVRQLLAFSHRQVVLPRAVDLSAAAASTVRLLERVLPSDIELSVALAPGLPPVLIDPGQLEQVLMNLVVNARDAMPQGGRLEIATALEGGSALLSVRDSGKGIAPELKKRIFEPFFTTKGPGKGTGLGLATCYGIVQGAGGRIEVESAPGAGSTFRVLLPAAEHLRPRVTPPGTEPVTARGTETLLLAEDEPQVRAATSRMLSSLGYRVLEAEDGAAALAVAQGAPFDLLVTDVMMPGLGGPALAAQLRQKIPGLRTLFLSGYAESGSLDADLLKGAGFLSKPFSRAQLAAAVRELLDLQRASSRGPQPAPPPPHR